MLKTLRKLLEMAVTLTAFYLLQTYALTQVDCLWLASVLVAALYGAWYGVITALLSLFIAPPLNCALYVIGAFISGYAVTAVRDKMRLLERDYAELKTEHESLRKIHEDTLTINTEYERRILSSANGLPYIYSQVRKLQALQPAQVLSGIVDVVCKLADSDTVAVYMGSLKQERYRLLSSSPECNISVRTLQVPKDSALYTAIRAGEVYQGKLSEDEPDIVIPVNCANGSVVLVIIQHLSSTMENVNGLNVLRTLSLLLHDSLEKAIQYEVTMHNELYIQDTDILKPYVFKQRLELARAEKVKGVSDFCLLQLSGKHSAHSMSVRAGNVLRATDCMGTDVDNTLYALLTNTPIASAQPVIDRLRTIGISGTVVDEEGFSYVVSP